MQYVVLGYPNISQTDFDRIQDTRRTHDSLFDAVAPHFTFVFPTEKLTSTELADHTRTKMTGMGKFAVSLTRATVVEDESGGIYHAFLVPTEGERELIDTHDRLYQDHLASELRLDIPFLPHVRVGRSADKAAMEALADALNNEGLDIHGSIDQVTIASFDGRKVVDIDTVELGD